MPDKFRCTNCKKTSALEHWLITTSFLLSLAVEDVNQKKLEMDYFFCPVCGAFNKLDFTTKNKASNAEVETAPETNATTSTNIDNESKIDNETETDETNTDETNTDEETKS